MSDSECYQPELVRCKHQAGHVARTGVYFSVDPRYISCMQAYTYGERPSKRPRATNPHTMLLCAVRIPDRDKEERYTSTHYTVYYYQALSNLASLGTK